MAPHNKLKPLMLCFFLCMNRADAARQYMDVEVREDPRRVLDRYVEQQIERIPWNISASHPPRKRKNNNGNFGKQL